MVALTSGSIPPFCYCFCSCIHVYVLTLLGMVTMVWVLILYSLSLKGGALEIELTRLMVYLAYTNATVFLIEILTMTY